MTVSDNLSAIETIEEAMKNVTPGPWYPGHLGTDSTCQCRSIVDDGGYMGAIATVHVDNGLAVGDGGNDAPPAEEAAANMRYIAACNPVAISALLAEARKAEAMEREIAEKDAKIARLSKIIAECQWYWPGDDTSSDHCEGSAWEVVEANAARHGDVTEVQRGGVVEVMFCASLPPAEDSDSDDDFWVQEKTEEEARAKIEAETARRASTLLNGGSDAQG